MPELPEVETIKEELSPLITGLKIISVLVPYPKIVSRPEIGEFVGILKDRTILNVRRRAKYIIFELNGPWFLIVHLRMTGRFLIHLPQKQSKVAATPLTKHDHLQLVMSNGLALTYHDTRKFGRWNLVNDEQEILGKIGPEPLLEGFRLEAFIQLFRQRACKLKPLLLDQRFIAGLGNIYVDEALWEAKLNPNTTVDKLSKLQKKALFTAIRHVLKKGVDSKGTSLGSGKNNYSRTDGKKGQHQNVMQVFRRTGLPCPRCGTNIIRIVVAQRSTHICPFCQSL